MEIDTTGVTSDVASWRDFWEVAVAIHGMCIRQGREGFQMHIGRREVFYSVWVLERGLILWVQVGRGV